MTLKQLEKLYRDYNKAFQKMNVLQWRLYEFLRCDESREILNESNAEKWSSRRKLLKVLDPKMGEMYRHKLESGE